jgi:transcriptional regulator with XRE-family HTH domain
VISPGAASRVRDYLGKQGLRRSEFALRVGITERTLRKLLKTGRIKVAVVDQVAAEMGITKAELLAEPAGREGSG